jgi:hypothetical protein
MSKDIWVEKIKLDNTVMGGVGYYSWKEHFFLLRMVTKERGMSAMSERG